MKLIIISILSIFLHQTGTVGTLTKNNGEEVKLSSVKFFQREKVSVEQLSYEMRGEKGSIPIVSIKRLNLKESIERNKGVTTWKALIVTRSNEKLEVFIDLHEIRGIGASGKEEVYSSNSINKISM